MKKIINLILIGILFLAVAYLFNNRFFINYEISKIKSYTYEVEKALETQ
jgi:hypothetical protein